MQLLRHPSHVQCKKCDAKILKNCNALIEYIKLEIEILLINNKFNIVTLYYAFRSFIITLGTLDVQFRIIVSNILKSI